MLIICSQIGFITGKEFDKDLSFSAEDTMNQDKHSKTDVIIEKHIPIDKSVPVEDFETRMAFLDESDFWKKFMNLNAIGVTVVTLFLYGFFY